ncbi:methyl-accepting chemotaxis protein [Desulfonema magnum]|uniref:Methyl-accepting chemotaxis protein signailling domain-containing protein n=1 Tax=Desulfonema magnum TaxID=45655 RepID=A0A975GSI5_9BACT|nr:methyl-accepting chemotaxis protein [Desulfonema magnum]QTA92096.1 Methyl-accepting chemotaxis protein signailling domain-containing protein [Desulfonema magnum]
MFRLSSVRAKIMVLSALGIIGMSFIASLNSYLDYSIQKDMKLGRKSQMIAQETLHLLMIEANFINTNTPELLPEHKKLQKNLKRIVSEVESGTDNNRIRMLAEHIIRLEKLRSGLFQSMAESMSEIYKNKESLSLNVHHLNSHLDKVAGSISYEETMLMIEGASLDVSKAGLRSEIKNFMLLWYRKLLNIQEVFLFSDIHKYDKIRQDLENDLKLKEENIITILETLNIGELNNAWRIADEYLPKISELEMSVIAEWKKNKELMAKLEDTATEVRNAALHIVSVAKSTIEKKSKKARSVSLIAGGGGIIFLLVLSFLISKSVNRTLERLIKGLGEIAYQVASASGHVTSASYSLAERSSGQAASIEETSSSLEEMSSMTQQNAENAAHADSLMKKTEAVVEKADFSMNELTVSMEQIIRASKETFNIVKTIDDIAFQTNLLALNAAVEAAHAGEAGLGFAVVADEVRNLAMESANAAKNTSAQIEATVKKIQTGAEIVSRTGQVFSQLSEISAKVGDLVSEIAVASDDQARGIEQINKATAEINEVTQRNADSAEKSASVSEAMNIQAERMKGFVDNLAILVGSGIAETDKRDKKQAKTAKGLNDESR